MPNLKLLLQLLPLLQMITSLPDSPPGVKRVLAVIDIIEWVAKQTPFEHDDRIVGMIEDIVVTPEGKALVDYLCDQIGLLMERVNAAD